METNWKSLVFSILLYLFVELVIKVVFLSMPEFRCMCFFTPKVDELRKKLGKNALQIDSYLDWFFFRKAKHYQRGFYLFHFQNLATFNSTLTNTFIWKRKIILKVRQYSLEQKCSIPTTQCCSPNTYSYMRWILSMFFLYVS